MTIEEYRKFRKIWDLRARYRIKQIIEEMRNGRPNEHEKSKILPDKQDK